MGFEWRPGTGQNEFTYAAALGALAKLPKQALVPYAALGVAEPMLQFRGVGRNKGLSCGAKSPKDPRFCAQGGA